MKNSYTNRNVTNKLPVSGNIPPVIRSSLDPSEVKKKKTLSNIPIRQEIEPNLYIYPTQGMALFRGLYFLFFIFYSTANRHAI